MRGLIVAVLVFLLGLFGPLVLERFVKGACAASERECKRHKKCEFVNHALQHARCPNESARALQAKTITA